MPDNIDSAIQLLQQQAKAPAAPAKADPIAGAMSILQGAPVPPAPAKQQLSKTEEAIKGITERGWGTGWPKFAEELGSKVTDLASQVPMLRGAPAAAAGTAADMLTQFGPSMLTSGQQLKEPLVSALSWPAKPIMQSAIKPTMADRASGASDRAIQTMFEEGISPTGGGMDKVSKLVRALNDKVKESIAASPESVGVADVGSRLRDPYNRALNQVNPETDLKAIRGAWDEFRNSPQVAGKTELPVQLAQDLKQGTYRSLGGKTYGEVGSASIEAQKALARGLRETVASKVPEVVEPLKREAALMNVKDVAGARAVAEANKNPMGLAALRVDNPLAAATYLADRSAAAKAMLARALYQAGRPQVMAPAAIAGPQLYRSMNEQ